MTLLDRALEGLDFVCGTVLEDYVNDVSSILNKVRVFTFQIYKATGSISHAMVILVTFTLPNYRTLWVSLQIFVRHADCSSKIETPYYSCKLFPMICSICGGDEGFDMDMEPPLHRGCVAEANPAQKRKAN